MWKPYGKEQSPYWSTTRTICWAYPAMKHVPSGVIIRRGESVFLRSHSKELPHLALVKKIWKDPLKSTLSITVRWYGRLSDNLVTILPDDPAENIQSVDCVDDICYVLRSDADYKTYLVNNALFCRYPKAEPLIPVYPPFGTHPSQVFVLNKESD
jgi:hypothetical protein